jgi:hypothetical protein
MERNLVQNTETRISQRTEDAVLKAEAPADELFGKDHKPQELAEQPKHHKPRFIDEQQDTGSKLQADYATHREETPLTFENNAPAPTPPVENTEAVVPEKPTPCDDRSESAEQVEPEPEYSSELYEDWRSDAGGDDAPTADKATNFDFRAGVVADTDGKSGKHKKFRIENETDTDETVESGGKADDKHFSRHNPDDFNFRETADESEQTESPEGAKRHSKPKFKAEDDEDQTDNAAEDTDLQSDEPVFKEEKTRKSLQMRSSAVEKLSDKRSSPVKDKAKKLKQRRKRDEADAEPFERPSTAELPITSQEERAGRRVERYEKRVARTEQKLEKAQSRAEKAESRLPHERVIKSEKTVNSKSGKPKRRLKFEKQTKPSDKAANPVVSKTKGIVSGAVSCGVNTVKNEFRKYEEENPALKALDGSIQVGESALRFTRKEFQKGAERLRQSSYKRATKLQYEADKVNKKLNMHRNQQQVAEAAKKKAQRKAIKKAQQRQARKKAQKAAKKTAAETAKKVEEATAKVVQGVINVLSNPIALIVILIIVIIIVLIFLICSMFGSVGSTSAPMALLSSYTAEESDIYSSDAYMSGLEDSLRQQIEQIPESYPDYDEYRFDIAPIGHNPYALTSYLSAIDPMFTADSAKGDIDRLFNALYNLSVSSIEEKRKITVTFQDEEGNTQTKQIEITIKILQVTLTANDFDSVVQSLLTADQYEMYQILQSTQGNRPDLF